MLLAPMSYKTVKKQMTCFKICAPSWQAKISMGENPSMNVCFRLGLFFLGLCVSETEEGRDMRAAVIQLSYRKK